MAGSRDTGLSLADDLGKNLTYPLFVTEFRGEHDFLKKIHGIRLLVFQTFYPETEVGTAAVLFPDQRIDPCLTVETADPKIDLGGQLVVAVMLCIHIAVKVNQQSRIWYKLSGKFCSVKAEVQVKFKGYPVMPTGVWIKSSATGIAIEYVAGEMPVINGLPESAVLKAWNEEYDVLVYEDGDRLLWLIGSPIDRNTEVIYHIRTDESEKLPDRRVQYGFDNRGFRVGTERAENELGGIDHYRVFKKEIPQEYNVTAVAVGFNTDGTVTWNDSFRIE